MALCVGGPFLPPGMTTDVVSVRGFQQAVDDAEICVDDLRVLTDAQLVEQALQEPEQQGRATATPILETSASDSLPEKSCRKRPERDTSVPEQQKPQKNLKEEREISKEFAKIFLHSLKDEHLTPFKRGIRCTTSLLSAPLTSSNNNMNVSQQELGPCELLITLEFHTGKKKTQEFTVLGSQPLTALRDLLYCVAGTVADSERVNSSSGYFLIENTFFNDMRSGEAIDYSEPILKFLQQQREANLTSGKRKMKNVPDFQSARMEETLFVELNFRLGVKYLYCHQGDCKHWLVFRDVRMLNCEDFKDPAAYPILKFLPYLKRKKCIICGVYRATKVSYEDEAVASSPCLFCENCFDMLHSSGKKNDFRVRNYFHE